MIAAGFSGSFPGLNVAVAAAARALDAKVIAISPNSDVAKSIKTHLSGLDGAAAGTTATTTEEK